MLADIRGRLGIDKDTEPCGACRTANTVIVDKRLIANDENLVALAA